MRDLTVADIHTYYVIADDEPVLVHNNNGLAACVIGGSGGDPVKLQAKVDALTAQMGAGAGFRTAGGLYVAEGVDLFAVGARAEISEAQIKLLEAADEAFRIYPGLPSVAKEPLLLGRLHAEGKLIIEAMNLGVEPRLLIASRIFCPNFCAPLIKRTGGRIITPTMAEW